MKFLIRPLLRILGSGKIPDNARFALEQEHIDVMDEGLWASITFRNFRSRGRACTWKRQWFLGAVAISRERLVAYRYACRVVNVVFTEPMAAALVIEQPAADRVVISQDASQVIPDASGTISWSFQTAAAEEIVGLAQRRMQG